ncbi:hypothetical protein [Metapseudomonas otitidis]|uniref:hypothetical protein n=1 Tax=Metapseudomonas otitidis TaxID=319939 RepID=UPI0013F5EE02|nr:hypothetical protein [Pseudomonas otitidis]
MGTLVIVAVISIIAIMIYLTLRNDRIVETADLAHRAILLSKYCPRLALEMALGMKGMARHLAVQQVAPRLILSGDEEAGIAALKELPEGYQQDALEYLLERYLVLKKSKAALTLLERFERPFPDSRLLKAPLLLAIGEERQALHQLETMTFLQEQGTGQRLSGPQYVILSRVQRSLEQPQAAIDSLERAWEAFKHIEHYGLPTLHDLSSVTSDLAELGETQRALELAKQLTAESQNLIAINLLQANQTDIAFSLLTSLGTKATLSTYLHLIDYTLNENQTEETLKILDSSPAIFFESLLLGFINWHVNQGQLAQVQTLLDAHAHQPDQRIWILLTLWEQHSSEHPEWANELCLKALTELEPLNGQEPWPHLRLMYLQSLLTQHIANAPDQRSTPETQAALDEIEKLNNELELEDRLIKLDDQVRLLLKLGKTKRARRWVDESLKRVDESQQVETSETASLSSLLFDLGRSYLSLGDHGKAKTMLDRLRKLGSERYYILHLDAAILMDHIQSDRLEEAINTLSLEHLGIEENPIDQLNQSIQLLQQSDGQLAKNMRKQLIEKLHEKFELIRDS